MGVKWIGNECDNFEPCAFAKKAELAKIMQFSMIQYTKIELPELSFESPEPRTFLYT